MRDTCLVSETLMMTY